jgi:signal transduction histidine kinase
MSRPLRVLLIGDLGNIGAGELAAELERGGYHPSFERAAAPEDLERAFTEHWDLAISCFPANTFGALEALRFFREHNVEVPLIAISNDSADARAREAIEAGAADCLATGDLSRLDALVARELRAARLRCDQRQIELQNQQARKLEALGRLAGKLAHDFNNVLTVIGGYTEMLLSTSALEDSDRTALQEVNHASEQAAVVTRQLLAFSRRQHLQNRKVSINELITESETKLRELVGPSIDLTIIRAASQDITNADTARLEQVVLELARNARDAMPNGGRLLIETATVDVDDQTLARQLGVKPGRYIMLSLSDTGQGMDAETQSQLFEPYFTTKSRNGALGLSLATAYGFLRQSGGAIAISSEPGKGTTARIYLPLADGQAQSR